MQNNLQSRNCRLEGQWHSVVYNTISSTNLNFIQEQHGADDKLNELRDIQADTVQVTYSGDPLIYLTKTLVKYYNIWQYMAILTILPIIQINGLLQL